MRVFLSLTGKLAILERVGFQKKEMFQTADTKTLPQCRARDNRVCGNPQIVLKLNIDIESNTIFHKFMSVQPIISMNGLNVTEIRIGVHQNDEIDIMAINGQILNGLRGSRLHRVGMDRDTAEKAISSG
ncbi:MAG: hypothetical protein OXE94_07345 [Aestuariivita sp.]|nr:hypothetical protein [Aestuariivita sp.]MCY4202053.1 hypothetical protein [Aestuariivita sp.]